MAGEPLPASEARVAAATATAEAQEASIAETAEVVQTAAVARAQERAEDAEEIAADIALAALQTELGQQVAAIAQEVRAWQNGHQETHNALTGELALVRTHLDAITAQLAQAVTALPPIVAVSSTPAALPGAETTATIVQPAAAESPAPMPAENAAPGKRRIKFI